MKNAFTAFFFDVSAAFESIGTDRASSPSSPFWRSRSESKKLPEPITGASVTALLMGVDTETEAPELQQKLSKVLRAAAA